MTLRPDDWVGVPIDLVFVGPQPPDHDYAIEVTVDAAPVETPGPRVFSIEAVERRTSRATRCTLRAPPGPVELKLSVRGQDPVLRRVFAAPRPEGQAHRVDVPVASWTASDRSFLVRLVRAGASQPRSGCVIAGNDSVEMQLGDERTFTMTPLGPVAALSLDDRERPFVAAPRCQRRARHWS